MKFSGIGDEEQTRVMLEALASSAGERAVQNSSVCRARALVRQFVPRAVPRLLVTMTYTVNTGCIAFQGPAAYVETVYTSMKVLDEMFDEMVGAARAEPKKDRRDLIRRRPPAGSERAWEVLLSVDLPIKSEWRREWEKAKAEAAEAATAGTSSGERPKAKNEGNGKGEWLQPTTTPDDEEYRLAMTEVMAVGLDRLSPWPQLKDRLTWLLVEGLNAPTPADAGLDETFEESDWGGDPLQTSGRSFEVLGAVGADHAASV